jgi:glycosyltransferase involved in cell wall biosynthesis
MDVSVIVCTYNRCEVLKRNLESLKYQVTPANLEWELIVVDNNCSDSTPEIVQKATTVFPVPLRYVREEKQGLSHARNRGISEAQGRYLLFTDDDTQPDNHWVATAWRTFNARGCHAVAGRVELTWLCQKPRWMTDELLGFLAHVDYGTSESILESDESPPFGANMAFAKSVFDTVGGFDPKLGRRGDKLVGGEETDLFARFLRAGFTAVYQPESVVYHGIEASRMHKSYFRRLHFNEGQVRGARYLVKRGKNLAGIPLFVFPQLLRSVWIFLTTGFHSGFQRSLRKEMNVWYLVGFIVGSINRRSIQ